MGILKGRVFEKAGVHVSTVFGTFAPEFAAQIPGAAEDPRFFATGISLIAHPWNPQCPRRAHEHALRRDDQAVVWRRRRSDAGAGPPPRRRTTPTQSNFTRRCAAPATRMARSPITPAARMVRRIFPSQAPRRAARNRRHFLRLPQQRRRRGQLGWEKDFAFTRDVGEAFLNVYPAIVRKQFRHALDRRRPRGAADPARALCRVQPALRSRHDLRPQDRRQCRVDSLVNAADREMAVRPAQKHRPAHPSSNRRAMTCA